MQEASPYRIRKQALAAATALALSAGLFATPAFAAGRVNLSGIEASQGHDRFIVKYRSGSASLANVRASLGRVAATRAGGSSVSLGHARRLAIGADLVTTSRRLDRVQAEALMRQIAADPNVEYVEIDRKLRATLTPNDPFYASHQWHYFEAVGGIKADKAWDVTKGAGVVVAVIDTGITSHTDLNANVLPGYDFISDAETARDGNARDNNPADEGDWYAANECADNDPASDSSWHGSHVAGTVAAVTSNAKGVAGVAHQAKVVPVRVLGKCGGYTSDIVDGIIWASGGTVAGVPANANPAEVINMSLGGEGSCSLATQNAINGAVARGTTVVVAAGNDNADVVDFNPGNCNNVVSVASTTRTGARSSFSNYGAKVDVAAPGSEIASTVNQGTTVPAAEGYALMSGTSMASPHVAGVVALMQAAAGSTPKTPAQIEAMLKSTARAFPATPSQVIGAGIVNAEAAVAAARVAPIGTPITKGVPFAVARHSSGAMTLRMDVPAGATNLVFITTGTNGNADLYVRRGGVPDTVRFDCKSAQAGSVERCTIAAPVAGTYYVRLYATSVYTNLTVLGDYAMPVVATYSNYTQFAIPDMGQVDSPIVVSGRTGNVTAVATVRVNIAHTYRGDLRIDLVAPDGSLYPIKSSSDTDSADNVTGSTKLNLSSEMLNGTWKLRVADGAAGDTGKLIGWNITF